jgi:hypothetical protein
MKWSIFSVQKVRLVVYTLRDEPPAALTLRSSLGLAPLGDAMLKAAPRFVAQAARMAQPHHGPPCAIE